MTRRLRSGETLRFRGPLDPGVGILYAAAAFVVLLPLIAGPLALLDAIPLRALEDDEWRVILALLVCWLGIIVLAMVRLGVSIARACGWVEFDAAGVTIRDGFLPRRLRWEDIRDLESDGRGGLRIRRTAGPWVPIRPGLSNGMFLENLLRDRIKC